jgi:flagellar protein FliO/FliZ
MARSVPASSSREFQTCFLKKILLKKWGLVSLLLMLACSSFTASYAADNAVEHPVSSATGQDLPEDNALAPSHTEPSQTQAQQPEAQTSSSLASVTPFYDKSAAPAATPATTSNVGSAGHLVNTVIGLALIIALIFGLSFFVKRFGAGGFTNNNQLKILSSMPLGTRERIVLIDAAGQQILLGITPTNINALHVFPEPVVVSNDNTAQSDFGKTLMTLLQSKKSTRAAGGNNTTSNPGNNDNNSSVV